MLLPDTVTLAQAATLLPQLDAAVAGAVTESSGRFTLDASALAVFDSSALALMLQARRLAEAHDLVFELHALPAQLRQLAELYGVAELLAASAGAASSSTAPRSVAT
jgi:phospholipid transport system transporter-binding protein